MSTTTIPDVGDVVAVYDRPAGYGPNLHRIVDTTAGGVVAVEVSPFDFSDASGPTDLRDEYFAANEWEVVG